MRAAVISSSGIRVSRFGYGTGSLHRAFSARERHRLLDAAADLGFTHFDTSPYYGYGLAETDLGVFLRGRRARFTLTTKIGLYPWGPAARHAAAVWVRKAVGRALPTVSLPVSDFDEQRARRSLDDSLRRLGAEMVDFLLLHEPDRARVNTEAILGWLQSERQAGRIRAWGVAGIADRIAPFVADSGGLAAVVQTSDSLEGREADVVTRTGRSLDFTYGYFGGAATAGANSPAQPADVLARNATGCILVSSHRIERLKSLAEAAA